SSPRHSADAAMGPSGRSPQRGPCLGHWLLRGASAHTAMREQPATSSAKNWGKAHRVPLHCKQRPFGGHPTPVILAIGITGRRHIMTPELMYLVWSVALTVLLVVISVAGATQEVGLPTLAGNREGLPEMTGWAGRAQ